jgi:plastocyanin
MRIIRLAALAAVLIAAPALAGDLAVNQKDQTFSTPVLNVHTGDKVVWHNNDAVTHNITVRGSDGDSEDLGLQKPGSPVSYTFSDKGAFRVVCSIHPKMKMTVNVQ